MIRPPILLPDRLPYKLPKPYTLLPRMGAQSVTIAAGFQCSNGVVLCADTEINIPGFVKFPGSKIRLYPRIASRPVFTFAGDVLFCEMLITKLAASILLAERNGVDVISATENEALEIHRKFVGESYEAVSGLLLSLWLGADGSKQRHLFEIGTGVVARVPQAALGTGQSVTRGMMADLFRAAMSVEETALLSVYLLAEAKSNAYGVGKSSQILMLRNDGSREVFPGDPHYSTIPQMEEDYTLLKRLLRPILREYPDLDASSEHFDGVVEMFKAGVVAAREKRRISRSQSIDSEAQRAIDRALDENEDVDEGED